MTDPFVLCLESPEMGRTLSHFMANYRHMFLLYCQVREAGAGILSGFFRACFSWSQALAMWMSET
ncbi:MAG: hypothetical protein LUH14_06105 [Clostridiaceae bacterium]|nr:hypothetical protein [Clostridiaceae bacterium]